MIVGAPLLANIGGLGCILWMLTVLISDTQPMTKTTVQLRDTNWNCPVEYLSLPPTRHDLPQGQKPEGQLKWG